MTNYFYFIRLSVFALALSLCLAVPAFAMGITVNTSHLTNNAYGNSPTSDGLTQPSNVTSDTNVSVNPLTIATGGSVLNAFGGYVDARGSAASVSVDCTLIIDGGMVSGQAIGGAAYSGTGSAIATNNTVIVDSGGNAKWIYGGYAHSSGGPAEANTNTVTIANGTVTGDIYGGWTNTGTATGNTVTITTIGNSFTNIYGGFANSGMGDIFTGNTLNLDAGNTITSVQNMAVVNFTSAGSAGIDTLDTTARGASGTPLVTMNTDSHAVGFSGIINGTGGINKTGTGILTLSGANTYTGNTNITAGKLLVSGSLGNGTYAGAIANSEELEFNQSGAQTLSGVISGTGNLTKSGAGTLTLTGTNTYSGNTTVSGGTLFISSTGDIGTGTNNVLTGGATLHLAGAHTKDWAVSGAGRIFADNGGLQSFGDLNANGASLTFVLPAGVVANQTIVSVDTADLDNAVINIDDDNVRVNMALGQSVKLIDASTSLTANGMNLTVQTANGDIFALQVSGNDLLMILQHLSPTSPAYARLKAYAEGRAASLAFVSQGQDLLLSQGLKSALAATNGPGFQMAAFGGLGGGSSRYSTGSHVDVEGMALLAGVAMGNETSLGRVTFGAFFEGGWGDYDSHNSFVNYAQVNGDGDTSYMGGGILGRYDVTSGSLSGLYFDASARLGRVSTDFNTSNITYGGRNAVFDTSALYYGLHGGLGYEWNISGNTSLDLSAKLLWTHQEADEVNVYGDAVRFDDNDSLRTRLGGRVSHAVNAHITPYIGAYWEHEFYGKAESTVNNVRIDAPTLKGSTGIGELGFSFTPATDNNNLSLDLGIQGYTGTREGISGSLQMKWAF